MKKDGKAIEKLKELERNRTPISITTPSIFELWVGVVMCNEPEAELEKIEEVLDGQTIIDLDKDSAEAAGTIHGKFLKKGELLKPIDSLVAGIARTKSERVLTRNNKDFIKRSITTETY